MNWRFSIFLLAIFALLFGLTWATSEVGMCSNSLVAALVVDKTKDGAVNCFEFWLNRYQSLIGAVIALIAAWIATIPARAQLREMAKQSAASARQSRLEIARFFDEEATLINRIGELKQRINQLINLYDEENHADIYQYFPDIASEIIQNFRPMLEDLKGFQSRSPEGDSISESRRNLIFIVDDLISAVSCFWSGFRSSIGDIEDEEGEVAMTRSAIKMARENVEDSKNMWSEAVDVHKSAISTALRKIWNDIHALETKMIAD